MWTVIAACLEIATKQCVFKELASLAGVQTSDYAQSIIGATEKRRESRAGVAVIGGIGGSEMGEAGRRGVYQDWGYRAQASFSAIVLCWSRSAHERRGVRVGAPL